MVASVVIRMSLGRQFHSAGPEKEKARSANFVCIWVSSRPCCFIVSEMTYNVSSGTLNTTIPYHCWTQTRSTTVYGWQAHQFSEICWVSWLWCISRHSFNLMHNCTTAPATSVTVPAPEWWDRETADRWQVVSVSLLNVHINACIIITNNSYTFTRDHRLFCAMRCLWQSSTLVRTALCQIFICFLMCSRVWQSSTLVRTALCQIFVCFFIYSWVIVKQICTT